MSKNFKNRIKSVSVIFIALLLLISFTGCSSNKKAEKTAKSFKYEIVKTKRQSTGNSKQYDLYVVIKKPLSEKNTTNLFKQIVKEFKKEHKTNRINIYLYDDERDVGEIYNLGACIYTAPVKGDTDVENSDESAQEDNSYDITYIDKRDVTKPTEDEMKFYYAVNELKDDGVSEPKAIKRLAKEYGYTKDEATQVYGTVYGYKTPY